MRKIFISIITVLGIAFTVASCSNNEKATNNDNNNSTTESTMEKLKFDNASPEQISGIRKALDAYIEAAVKGDSKIAEPVFTDNATISHIENDSLISLPIKALFDYYNNDCPQPASYEITVCNVSDDVAIVAIDSDFGGTKFDDMFSMVKDGNEWKIVSKIFHVK